MHEEENIEIFQDNKTWLEFQAIQKKLAKDNVGYNWKFKVTREGIIVERPYSKFKSVIKKTIYAVLFGASLYVGVLFPYVISSNANLNLQEIRETTKSACIKIKETIYNLNSINSVKQISTLEKKPTGEEKKQTNIKVQIPEVKKEIERVVELESTPNERTEELETPIKIKKNESKINEIDSDQYILKEI